MKEIHKAEGLKIEEIMTIEHTAANEERRGNIKVSNLKLTTLEYETKRIKYSHYKKVDKNKKKISTQLLTLLKNGV